MLIPVTLSNSITPVMVPIPVPRPQCWSQCPSHYPSAGSDPAPLSPCWSQSYPTISISVLYRCLSPCPIPIILSCCCYLSTGPIPIIPTPSHSCFPHSASPRGGGSETPLHRGQDRAAPPTPRPRSATAAAGRGRRSAHSRRQGDARSSGRKRAPHARRNVCAGSPVVYPRSFPLTSGRFAQSARPSRPLSPSPRF